MALFQEIGWIRHLRIFNNTSAYKIDFENKKINDFYNADIIVNTIPWTEYKELIGLDDLFR